MVRQDLFGGIKNALDRGQTLEEVIKSFVSAGYPEQDVRQAAQALTTGRVPELPPSQKLQDQKPGKEKNPWPVQTQAQQPVQQVKPKTQEKQGKKMDWKLITLVGVLIILVLVLAGSILFKEQITSIFVDLFG